MPLTKKGKKIMQSMKEQYGSKKGESVFYASANKGKIKGVEKAEDGKMIVKKKAVPPKKGPDSQGVSWTDMESSGVTYKDPSGKTISKEEWFKQTDKQDKEYKLDAPVESILEEPSKKLIKKNLGGMIGKGKDYIKDLL